MGGGGAQGAGGAQLGLPGGHPEDPKGEGARGDAGGGEEEAHRAQTADADPAHGHARLIARDERAAHDIKPRCGPTWGSPARLISTVSLDVVAKFRDTVLAPRVTPPPGISSWRRRDPTASAARG